ncbi:MAG: PadR family transcriptional regulator [Anaerolineae bacterium]
MRIMEPMILLLLAETPAHGYLLAERLEEIFRVQGITPQTVYRALQHMEAAEWIVPSWDMESAQGPPRKVYEITPAGEAALAAWAEHMQRLHEMTEVFLERYQAYAGT